MYQIIIIFHVLVGLSIIGLVLMQQGRGADAGAAFGSGASGTVFGAQGSASFLSRTTAVFALIFFSTSLGLAVIGGGGFQDESKDLMDTPEVEKSLPDLPFIGDDAAPMKVPSISDQQAEDVPAISEPENNEATPDVTKQVPQAAEQAVPVIPSDTATPAAE